MILLHLLTGYEEVSNEGDTAEEEADLHLFSGDGGEEVSHMGAADGEESVIGELLLDLGPLTLCFSYQMDKRLPQYFGWLLH